MIHINNVSKKYQTKNGIEVNALKNISLQFKNKGLYFILGKSGSGKTTLLNLISGLDTPTNGNILINGVPIKDIDDYRNSYVGIIFQENNLFKEFNVKENIELASKLQGIKSTTEEISNILENIEIQNLLNRNIDELSGGQQQRVAIARALQKKSKVLIADEPTGSLDSATAKSIFSCLKKISEEQLVIVVTHESEFAYAYGDEVILLEDGEVKNIESLHIIEENEEVETTIIKKRHHPIFTFLKMGLMNIKLKLLRFFLIILLSTFSLICLGVALTTLTYNKANTILSALKANEYIDPFVIQAKKHTGNSVYQTTILPEDLNKINDELQLQLKGVFKNYETQSNFYNPELINRGLNKEYWDVLSLSSLSGFISVEEELDFTIIGRYPCTKNEIAIPYYFYQTFKEYGYSYQNVQILPNEITEEKILGQTLVLEQMFSENKINLTIVGIIDTNLKLDKFKELKRYSSLQNELEGKNNIIRTIQTCSFHSVGYLTQEALEEYFIMENGYQYLLGNMPTDTKIKETILYLNKIQKNDISFELYNSTNYWLNVVHTSMTFYKGLGIIAGVILAVFSGLLLFSFISIILKQKEREMGVFRALGARSKDVFLVFFGDGIFIGLVSFVLSLIGTLISVHFLNQDFQNTYQISISLYSFGFLQCFTMFVLIFAVIFIATFYPILKIARKPIAKVLKQN